MAEKIGKIFLVFFAAALLLCGCSEKDDGGFENTKWVLDTVQDIKNGGKIIACSEESKSLYENAKVINFVCRADKNNVIFENIAENQKYSGTYDTVESTDKTVIYRITVDGKEGIASVSDTVFEGGGKTKTLVIGFDDYALKFFEKQK